MVELFGVALVEAASPRALQKSPAGYKRTKELRDWNCRVEDPTYDLLRQVLAYSNSATRPINRHSNERSCREAPARVGTR